ncbi:MAG: AAA family ATPase [Candidatus Omnitrophica bacterium]|nr:AAA family ATPase [Candidatus Omnitrophota bacterium]
MGYYEVLNLKKEPFSTSPDPAFLYRSSAHNSVLKRLEIGIRLRRGLSLILGDVGTGKTTLSRALLQEFSNDNDFVFHMILDPDYNSEFQLLETLVKIFGITPDTRTTHDYKEEIEKYLFKKGIDEHKTIVLLIDEGQKLHSNFLEVLRTLLNYETNEYKLLQLVIMSQMELLPKIKRVKNFYDRIALKYIINPLDMNETKEMINFRLKQAGLSRDRHLFTPESVKRIFEYSQGYPRKIAVLCHNSLEELIIKQKDIVDEQMIFEIIKKEDI